MATKKPRNKKYNPDAAKHIAPGHQQVEEHQLTAGEMTQLVLLENIKRQAIEAQTNYLLQLASKRGYPDGIRCTFDMDWENSKVRVTILGKAQPASLKSLNKKESKP